MPGFSERFVGCESVEISRLDDNWANSTAPLVVRFCKFLGPLTVRQLENAPI